MNLRNIIIKYASLASRWLMGYDKPITQKEIDLQKTHVASAIGWKIENATSNEDFTVIKIMISGFSIIYNDHDMLLDLRMLVTCRRIKLKMERMAAEAKKLEVA